MQLKTKSKEMPVAMTIAGSDSGGGAGIQADLATFSGLGVFGTSVITALTAQNPESVSSVENTSLDMVEAQFRQVMDFFPVKAAKTGMLPNAECVELVEKLLEQYASDEDFALVVDPVMVATSGSKLAGGGVVEAFRNKLFLIADLVTPNVLEVEVLLGWRPESVDDLEKAGLELINQFGVSFLIKGGHLDGDSAVDVLVKDSGQVNRFTSPRIEGVNSHGSGCSLAAGIAAGLAKGESLQESISNARSFLEMGFRDPVRIGGVNYLRRNFT
jgi:hydroxymethylpyrimidine kinase/phosphomethylpyrimidine kinase